MEGRNYYIPSNLLNVQTAYIIIVLRQLFKKWNLSLKYKHPWLGTTAIKESTIMHTNTVLDLACAVCVYAETMEVGGGWVVSGAIPSLAKAEQQRTYR